MVERQPLSAQPIVDSLANDFGIGVAELTAWTYADAETTLRDFARVGQLVLDRGLVGGNQVVPSTWISQCLLPTSKSTHYGLLWWLDWPEDRPLKRFFSETLPRALGLPARISPPSIASTQGYLNTDCYVLLDAGVVAARMQMRQAPQGTPVYRRTKALRILQRVVPTTG